MVEFVFYPEENMDYMSIAEASKKWGISTRRIQILCSEERIPGAERMGYCWAYQKMCRNQPMLG
jgi:hypothetical protein